MYGKILENWTKTWFLLTGRCVLNWLGSSGPRWSGNRLDTFSSRLVIYLCSSCLAGPSHPALCWCVCLRVRSCRRWNFAVTSRPVVPGRQTLPTAKSVLEGVSVKPGLFHLMCYSDSCLLGMHKCNQRRGGKHALKHTVGDSSLLKEPVADF